MKHGFGLRLRRWRRKTTFSWLSSMRKNEQNYFLVLHRYCYRDFLQINYCENFSSTFYINSYPLKKSNINYIIYFFDLKFVSFCPKFSGDYWVEFQEKPISGEFFRNFVQFWPNLCNFIMGPYCAEKKIIQALSCIVYTQAKRQVHKRITKRRCGEERPGRFVFGKSVLFTIGLGLTTPYSSGVSVWNFYQTFATMCIDFWLRFDAQIRPTRLAISILFITAKAETKVRLCLNLINFFRGWVLIRLTWNLSCFILNSVEGLSWNFRKKLFRENFSEIWHKPRLSSTKTCEISPYFLQFYSGSVMRWKNSHKYFLMFFGPR